MELKDFTKKVQKAIRTRLGENYRIELQQIHKNNNVILQGLLIHTEERNISPTIYLNSFWEAYEKGIPFEVIVGRILQIYEEDTPRANVDMSFFKDFDRVKDRICYRLISAEKNRELLKGIPYMEYLDLAICFYYSYRGEALGNGSILVHDSHVAMWNTSKEELYELARQNTPKLFPKEWNSMETVLGENMPQQEDGEGISMQILSNADHVHGAACMLYPGVLSEWADSRRQNLYIIPSSVHEVIVLPDSGREDPDRLREMIAEVNMTQVEPEEILSDNLYYYDRILKQVEIVR